MLKIEDNFEFEWKGQVYTLQYAPSHVHNNYAKEQPTINQDGYVEFAIKYLVILGGKEGVLKEIPIKGLVDLLGMAFGYGKK